MDSRTGVGWLRAFGVSVATCVAASLAGATGGTAEAQELVPPDLFDSVDPLICNSTSEQVDRWEPSEPAPQEPFLGFNEDAVAGVHGISPTDYAGHVRTIGGNALRTNLDWRNAEPKRDCWSQEWWAHWRDFYIATLTSGVRPIFIISAAPEWARNPTAHERNCKGYAGCVFPPRREMDSEWAEYAAEVAHRFPEALIEVWNEPNLGSMWSSGPNPERFAELVVLAHDAIKAVSPETRVVLGGLLGVRRTKRPGQEMALRKFLAGAYQATPSIRGSFDYLGLHPYTTWARVGKKSLFGRTLRTTRAIRDAHEDPTPILVTEFGVSTATPNVDEDRQTRVLDKAHRRLGAAPDVAGVLYHRVVEPRDTTDDALEIGYAWLRHGGRPAEPRPVYCHFAELAGDRRAHV
jgi:hypothetical protein